MCPQTTRVSITKPLNNFNAKMLYYQANTTYTYLRTYMENEPEVKRSHCFANLLVIPTRKDIFSKTLVLMHVAKGTRDVSQHINAAVMQGCCRRSIKGPRFKSCPTNEGQVTFPSDLLRRWCADLSRFRRKNEVPRDCSREF